MSTHDITARSTDNPYQPIVIRNVFRLNALPEPETGRFKPLPPPIITLQGIASYPCRKQALFKVVMATNHGGPPKEVSLVLNEGSRLGEIEVLEINERAATVKFRNHGQEQSLCLNASLGKGGAE